MYYIDVEYLYSALTSSSKKVYTYISDVSYNNGDTLVVETVNGAALARVVCSRVREEESDKVIRHKLVICKVDYEAFEARKARIEAIRELESKQRLLNQRAARMLAATDKRRALSVLYSNGDAEAGKMLEEMEQLRLAMQALQN